MEKEYPVIPLPKAFCARFDMAYNNSPALAQKLTRYLGKACDVSGASRVLHCKDIGLDSEKDEEVPPLPIKEFSETFQARYNMVGRVIRKRVDNALLMNDVEVANRILKLGI